MRASVSKPIQGFPWAALERIDRQAELGLRAARAWLDDVAEPARLAATLSELIGARVEFLRRGFSSRAEVRPEQTISFSLGSEASTLTLGFEPALATQLVASLLKRPAPLVSVDAPIDPVLRGVLSAVCIEAARRASAALALAPSERDVAAPYFRLEFTALVAGRPYRANLRFAAAQFATRTAMSPARALQRLGQLELRLPLVIGVALFTPAMLAELTLGSGVCFGSGFSVDRALVGRGVMVAPTSERGVAVELRADGKIVLGQPTNVALATEDVMSEADSGASDSAARAALEAPLVVRVELGSVSLSAQRWAELRPGDVIETGQRLGEPVVLRGGGRVLARGELVNIDGELGVRILELSERG